MPREVNLDAMNKKEFDKEMERRYKEAISEDGIEVNKYFKNFKNRLKKYDK